VVTRGSTAYSVERVDDSTSDAMMVVIVMMVMVTMTDFTTMLKAISYDLTFGIHSGAS
jgi:hypothetical protein